MGLHAVHVQPAPVQVQCEPPLQSTLHETAAVQSTLHVDLSAHDTSTVRPASTTTAQRLPPLQLALQLLPAAQVNAQSQPLVAQLKVQVAAASQVCAQQGLHAVVQSDEHAGGASVVARSAPAALAPPPGSLGANGPTAASVATSAEIGSPVTLKLHAPATTSTTHHIQRIPV